MDDAKKQLVDSLKQASNVLVTVSRSPSVDQLAALVGLTLLLNKQGKHAAAVFSGEIPSALEFLRPADTITDNTDSLRDFIISLDKAKADKLRYKVEDNVVRIFITPYRTSISESDFEFSQGDFNVDLVVALGVHQQEDLDEAITSHGRILHDATVASINVSGEKGLGGISWDDAEASSLCELVTELSNVLGSNLLDEQIATALLTGIVAETDRFRNDKTRSHTMSASATLMKAGANQQLVADELEAPAQTGSSDDAGGDSHDGALEIDHSQTDELEKTDQPELELPTPEADSAENDRPYLGEEPHESEAAPQPENLPNLSPGSRLMTQPPTLGGVLTANSRQEGLDPVTDPLSLPSESQPIIRHDAPSAVADDQTSDVTNDTSITEPAIPEPPQPKPPKIGPARSGTPPEPKSAPPAEPLAAAAEPPAPIPVESPIPASEPPASAAPPAPAWTPPPLPPEPTSIEPLIPASQPVDSSGQTLSDIEASVKSSEEPAQPDTAHLDAARDEVSRALTNADATASATPEPIQALNAQPFGGTLHSDDSPAAGPQPWDNDDPGPPPVNPGQPIPGDDTNAEADDSSPKVIDPTAPPPVPPPIPFQFGNQPPQQ